MDFLNAGRSLVRYANVHISVAQQLRHFAATPPREPDHHHLTRVRRLNSGQHIGRVPAGGYGQQHITGRAQRAHLAGKNNVEIVIVGDGRDDGTVGGQCDGALLGALAFKPPYKLCRKVLSIGRRAPVTTG